MFTTPRITEAVTRLKGAFELPEAALSLDEASRVSGLEKSTCRVVLEALQDAHFLTSDHDVFKRRTPVLM